MRVEEDVNDDNWARGYSGAARHKKVVLTRILMLNWFVYKTFSNLNA